MRYRVYGIVLDSNVELASLKPSDALSANISFTQHDLNDQRPDPSEDMLLRRSPVSIGGYVSHYQDTESHLFRFEGRADMRFSDDGTAIDCWANQGYAPWTLDILLGLGLSYALSLQGVGSIHGAGVVFGGGCIGLVAVPGTGKSTLATSLAVAGHPLITDDVLVLRPSEQTYLTSAGPPQVGLEPDKLARMQDSSEGMLASEEAPKQRIALSSHWSDEDAVPLLALYLLERDEEGGGAVVIEELPRQEALGALLVHTPPVGFLVNTGYAAHWRFLGQLVQQVPVRVLRYPSGFGRLAEIHTALERAHAQQPEEAAFLASR